MVRRWLMRAGYALRRRALARLRWRTRGCKVAAFDRDNRLLLVRHGYGRSDLWMLPGGGVGRRESPEAAARRELMEEVGCRIGALALVAEYRSAAEGKRDALWLFRGETADAPRPDGLEVVEARFFPLDAPPPTASPATLRRIAELRGERAAGGVW